MIRKFLFSSLLTSVSFSAYAHLEMFSDSGIEGPPYSEIVESLHELATEHPDWVTTFEYGESVRGKTLVGVKLQLPGVEVEDAPAVMISGATHGNEYLNIADRLPRWFVENMDSKPGLMRFFDAGGVIYIVPILNPDGYDRDQRANANGNDLNRDFDLLPANENNFSQPETSGLADHIDQALTANDENLKVAVDYHCCDGSLLYPWSYSRNSLPAEALDGHRQIARLMQEHINRRYEHGSTGQVLGYYPRGTSKDYWFAKYDAKAFTFEGKYRTENQNLEKHGLWWNAILSELIDYQSGQNN